MRLEYFEHELSLDPSLKRAPTCKGPWIFPHGMGRGLFLKLPKSWGDQCSASAASDLARARKDPI